MPLKVIGLLQRGPEHSEDINEAIDTYHEMHTHGNRYVRLYLDEDNDWIDDNEKRLRQYVLDMGFDKNDVVMVDAQDEAPEPVWIDEPVPANAAARIQWAGAPRLEWGHAAMAPGRPQVVAAEPQWDAHAVIMNRGG